MTLQIDHLCKDYPTRSGSLSVLRDLTLEVPSGEALAVMGPSGSGKSTLLYVVGTLERPSSGGDRQRVALARALVNRPKLLLADEPTGNLDRRTARAVAELLVELHEQEHTTLIVVTHSPELARLLPRRLEMVDGRLEPMEGLA